MHDAIDRLHQEVLDGELPDPGPTAGATSTGRADQHSPRRSPPSSRPPGAPGGRRPGPTSAPRCSPSCNEWIDADAAHVGRSPASSRPSVASAPTASPRSTSTLPDGRALAFRGPDRPHRRAARRHARRHRPQDRQRDASGQLTPDDPTLGGTRFQLPVYAAAARHAARPTRAPVRAEYAFFAKGSFSASASRSTTQVVGRRSATLAGSSTASRPAFFPARPEPPGVAALRGLRVLRARRPRHRRALGRVGAQASRPPPGPLVRRPGRRRRRGRRDEPSQLDSSSTATLDDCRAARAAARRRRRGGSASDTASTLFVEAGAGAGKTTALVDRILTLVDARRARSTRSPPSRSPRRRPPSCATGSARPRRRRRRSARARRRSTASTTRPIGTLHAFARRILSSSRSRPACRPASRCSTSSRASWRSTSAGRTSLDELLDDADREVAPGLRGRRARAALRVGQRSAARRGLRRVVEDFQANWDLVERARRSSRRPRTGLELDRVARRRARDLVATPTPTGDRQEELLGRARAAAADRLGRTPTTWAAALAALDELRHALRGASGRRQQGPTGGAAAAMALDDLRGGARRYCADASTASCAAWRRYRERVVGAIAGHVHARRRRGAGRRRHARVPRPARAGPPAARASTPVPAGALHDRYRRLLLDEFQDTDPIQIELAVRLIAAAGEPAATPPSSCRRPAGCSSSATRSSRSTASAGPTSPCSSPPADRLGAERQVLTANFRSTDAVIDWVNDVFGELIQAADGSSRRTDRSTPAGPGRATTARSRCSAPSARRRRRARRGAARARSRPTSRRPSPSALRERWLGRRRRRRRCGPPRRRHRRPAPGAHVAADARGRRSPRAGVPYRAENSSVVYGAPEVRDLCWPCGPPTTRPTSWPSWPRCARRCSAAATSTSTTGARPAGAGACSPSRPPGSSDHPVGRGPGHCGRSPSASARSSAAELLDALVDERRVLEAAPRPGPTPATSGAGSASWSTRPGRGPRPAGGACGATCAGPPTRPPRAGRARRSCPRPTTTPCGS